MRNADVLSIQLYTLRELGDFDRILEAVSHAGFRHVEMIGSHLEDPAKTRRRLEAHGLQASSSHVGIDQLRKKPEAMIDASAELGINELYLPAVPLEDRDMDAAGWRALGVELGDKAEDFQVQGIHLGYHNHHWELTPKEGEKTALELIFEAAGDSPLTWQADVAWLVRGKAEPEAWLARYADRLRSAHVKDIAPEGKNQDQDGWADVGAGTLDWPTLWQVCRARGAGWMVVEHDKPADPAGCARRSYDFLTNMTV
ncbi:MAG: sugar phosphate isomerase/epimerase family protein [Geminicoccaceae bacterium]|jgi:sugar phosphate isomerase/epimerase